MKRHVEKTIHLSLDGINGNAHTIMGAFKRQAKAESWSKEEIETVLDEAQSGDYDHLLATIMAHCEPKKTKDHDD